MNISFLEPNTVGFNRKGLNQH
uniref:Uncharacterized protein n=1 Tax=Rhizophora mucronata TaxID=61149 RepID=A0A2P2NR42_RHIMU